MDAERHAGADGAHTRPTERPSAPELPHVAWSLVGEPVRIDEVRSPPLASGIYPSLREPRANASDRATPKVPAFDEELFEGAVPQVPPIPRMTPLPQSGIVAVLATPVARREAAPLRAIREEVRVTRRDPRAEEDD